MREETRDTAGWEHLDRALAQGRGVVFATIHFGSWDAAGAAVAGHCPPGTVFAVAEPFGDPRLDTLVTKERAEYGLGVVPMHDVRRMVKLLRAGNVLGVLIDRPVTSGDGVTVRMFGRDTVLPAGAAALAGMARCPIIPGYLRRRSDGVFEGGILPAIEPVRTGNREADLAATMQQVVASLEGVVRRSPQQWYMFRDMWPAPAAVRAGRYRVGSARSRLGRVATRTAGYGSLLMAAWYASRLPMVRAPGRQWRRAMGTVRRLSQAPRPGRAGRADSGEARPLSDMCGARPCAARSTGLPRRAARGTGVSFLPSNRRHALRANLAVAMDLPIDDQRVVRAGRAAMAHWVLNFVDLFRWAEPTFRP